MLVVQSRDQVARFRTAELSIESREPMLGLAALTLVERLGQRIEHERPGGAEVARPVFVVDRQGLAGLAPGQGGRAARGQQVAPGLGRGLGPAGPPAQQRQAAQRFAAQPAVAHAGRRSPPPRA